MDNTQKPLYILYIGEISRDGYNKVTEICNEHRDSYSKVVFVLGTSGGDPHAGFRIARALQHYSDDGFTLVVPQYCKSAGTLIAIGASDIVIANCGELGPLDVQIQKSTELFERSSGLDLPQAIDALQQQVITSFRNSLVSASMGGRLSTRIAADIATNLTVGIFSPIFAQIDPIRLGESQRANYIGYEYGKRLSEKSKNLKPDALNKLIGSYPAHSFVIDRKEAKELFHKVRELNQDEYNVIKALPFDLNYMIQMNSGENPVVVVLPFSESKENEKTSESNYNAESGNTTISSAEGLRGSSDEQTATVE
ncbi:MAG: hypothetical protein IPP76_10800 [Moraxellaceae bacterium]|nr:hypothetical protein [Moraxellaceae bacterium]